MKIEKKIKLIYSIELIAIAIVALVIAVLRIAGVMKPNATRLLIYNIITIIGGIWLVTDLVWCLLSPRRKAKNCLLDKFLLLPLGLFLLGFDIFCFVTKDTPELFVIYGISGALIYLAVVYIFLGIYHYYKPMPQILEAIEEAKKEENKNNVIENKDEEKDGK